MTERKRINISIDPLTYERLRRVCRRYGFRSACCMMAECARLLVALTDENHAPPEPDWQYIARMFGELSDAERRPYGRKSVRHNNRNEKL